MILTLLLSNLAVVVGLMTAIWLLSLILRDVTIVDSFWGLGFVVIVWNTLLRSDEWTQWAVLLATMTTIWGIRLAGYLWWRNWGKPEDYRYQSLRKRFGSSFPLLSLAIVFLLQAALIWVVSLPLQTSLLNEGRTLAMPWLAIVGIVLWAIGLLFETVGDIQLARFKADQANEGKVLDRGLWRYTRHPNYFGDFVVWWGLSMNAMALGAPLWTLIGPLVMSVLLMRVSGVTLLEAAMRERKLGYREYVHKTSAFFPRPPLSG